jgi:beta-glucosidase
MRRFPENFVWGTATSAYQIEGATDVDGRGESIWDRFSRTPGNVRNGDTGDIACDHYHRFRDDIAIMKDLGLRAYRFSIAWPRIVPGGRGATNTAGLDFYSRLIDALLEAGIEPYPTLYHWDLPQPLQDEGGWTVRSTAEAFTTYAEIVSRHLGDRIKTWITHNEPWCASLLGYQRGIHAPGVRDFRAALLASHHLLLSHGLAVPVLRASSPAAEVGITLNLVPAVPASPSAADYEAYRHFDGFFNRWFLDPVFGRGYPADMIRDYIALGHLPPEGLTVVKPGDLEIIAAPCDFIGINYYNRSVQRSDKIPEEQNLPRRVHVAPSSEWTDIGWEVYPDGICDILTRVHLTYAPRKMYVTENGASYGDAPDSEGRVRDVRRQAYLREHLRAVGRAIDAGVPLAGYFLWSLLDNYEWDWGYGQRFGMVWVDYATQQRVPKDSALWYKKVIAENAVGE